MEKLIQWIKDSDFILVGCGRELSVPVKHLPEADLALKSEATAWIADYILANALLFGEERKGIEDAYRELGKCLRGKNLFLVSTAYDGACLSSGIYDGLIAAPEGNIGRMSCDRHIWNGEGWIGQIAEAVKNGVALEKLMPPVCPECGKKLAFHVKGEEWFEKGEEAGQWNAYQNWLSCTMGKKLCMLELGTAPADRELLTGPFERNLYWNRNAKLIRVGSFAMPLGIGNSGTVEDRENLKQRFLLVRENAAAFCGKLSEEMGAN